MEKTIEQALVNGIRETIKQFQKSPYSYFTESDIHSSLMNNIKKNNSDILIYQDEKSKLEVSLVHQEYPTNFRYKKSELFGGYFDINNKTLKGTSKDTLINSRIGDRGNYDLAILNLEYVKNIFINPIRVRTGTGYNNVSDASEALKHIINKDIDYAKKRCISLKDENINKEYYAKELERNIDYAVEVKLIHPFNARNKDMFYEIVKDNAKLNLANLHTKGFTKTINLVFCSSEEQERRVDKSNVYNKQPVISKIREYIKEDEVVDFDGKRIFKKPEGVINIFIESYLSDDKIKSPKPVVNMIGNTISNDLFNKLKNEI